MRGYTKPCRCECGYRCGGPGKCKLGIMKCLQQKEGHFVKDCDHDFTGKYVHSDAHGCSRTCKHCGTSAMGHDLRCGP